MKQIEQWDIFELTLKGPAAGNPFRSVSLSAVFTRGKKRLTAEGYYDGNGRYKLRFSPELTGTWHFRTVSNRKQLNGVTGSLECVKPSGNNHGPVRVRDTFHFEYADGTPHYSFGTTCYAWLHQPNALQEQTLATLKKAPFNKIRMCLFPKNYRYNRNNPRLLAFEGKTGSINYNRFNPAFWRMAEKRIGQLRNLGIEADIILFHPYDFGKWNLDTMSRDADTRYLRYAIARLGAYRNVWWSMSNEYDLFKKKSITDFDYIFRTVKKYDPYDRLRSNHNCRGFWDHAKKEATHCSIQHNKLERCVEWREQYGKPVVVDECRYEGNVPLGWGNLTAEGLVQKFWDGFCRGSYVGHGETYLHPQDILWWSRGGKLHGKSPERIAYLRKIIESIPADRHEPVTAPLSSSRPPAIGKPGESYLIYFGSSQPGIAEYALPKGEKYQAVVIDTWNMKKRNAGIISGAGVVKLAARPYMALQLNRCR